MSDIDQLLARIRRLPLEERLRLIERAAHKLQTLAPQVFASIVCAGLRR